MDLEAKAIGPEAKAFKHTASAYINNVCMYYVLLYVLLRGTSSLVQYFRCHIVCGRTVCCILYVCGQCSSLYVVMRTFLSNVVLHVYLLV